VVSSYFEFGGKNGRNNWRVYSYTTKPYLHKRGNRASIRPDELLNWRRWCNIVPQDNNFHAAILAAICIA
jgi:hypothetical protein